MVSTLEDQEAVTPVGKLVAVPMPVAPVVLKVISVIAEFTQTVGEPGLSKLYSFTLSFKEPITYIFVPSLLKATPVGEDS